MSGAGPRGVNTFEGETLYRESRHLPVFEHAARDRKTRLLAVTPEEIAAITDEEME